MTLWNEWLRADMALRPACRHMRTFVWMLLVLMGLSCRAENAGVTRFVRVLNIRALSCQRFLHLFHSKSLDLDVLTACWARVCLALFRPFEVGPRPVCLADGIKAPKEGKRMPAFKHLNQQSASNTQPECIMGRSLQAISFLVLAPGGQVAAVPLTSRSHGGLVFSGGGDPYRHRTAASYRQAVRRKLRAYHIHVQPGCVAQGLLQHLALNHTAAAWQGFRSWLRTMNPAAPPSELIFASTLRSSILRFLPLCTLAPELEKMADAFTREDLPPQQDQTFRLAA